MRRTLSLRLRLTAIILLPLMSIAVVIGILRLDNARTTAAEVFDRSLLSAAFAVANDVAISEGDALSTRTRDILESTSGAPVFYHVYAPDGVIVAGYATPPVGIPRVEATAARPNFFSATYLGRAVSGVRVQNRTEIDGFAGIFTTTVWQDDGVRTSFVRKLVLRSFATILALVLSLALIVWFGVRIGCARSTIWRTRLPFGRLQTCRPFAARCQGRSRVWFRHSTDCLIRSPAP